MRPTLNDIVADIELTLRAGTISQSDKISRNQIIGWIHQYRLLIIKQDIEKSKEINDLWTQQITGFQLQQVPVSTASSKLHANGNLLESVEDLPQLMILHDKPSLLLVFDMEGNPIQVGSKSKAQYQRYRKYTCNDYILYIQGNKLRLEGPNLINYVDLLVLLEDPTEMDVCGFENMPYPIPENKIPLLKNMIFSQELGIRQNALQDNITNLRDDLAINGGTPIDPRNLLNLVRSMEA